MDKIERLEHDLHISETTIRALYERIEELEWVVAAAAKYRRLLQGDLGILEINEYKSIVRDLDEALEAVRGEHPGHVSPMSS